MRILMKIDPFDRSGSNSPDEMAACTFSKAESQFNEEASLDDSYLYRPDEPDGFAEELNFVDGQSNPDEIRKIARTWNDGIQRDFDEAVEVMRAQTPKAPDGTHLWLQAPSSVRYDMKKAAMALDNSFYDFAKDLLLVVNGGYFTTILSADQLADIEAHPENYVKIDVYAK